MSSTAKLLSDIEVFLVRSGMTASEFGVAIRNDRALVNSLRGGASVTLATADKIREFMRTYRARSTRTRKRGRGPLGRSAAA